MNRLTEASMAGAVFVLITALSPDQANGQIRGCSPAPAIIIDGVVQNSGPTLGGRLANPCIPQAPDFVADDAKRLLTKIKLASDKDALLKQRLKSFATEQKKIVDVRGNVIYKEWQHTGGPRSGVISEAAARDLYLDEPMRELRNKLALEIRSLVSAEQTTRFEANLAALKLRDAR